MCARVIGRYDIRDGYFETLVKFGMAAPYRRRPCKTSYVHETKFYRRDKKRSGVVVIHIYLLIFKYRFLNQLLISML